MRGGDMQLAHDPSSVEETARLVLEIVPGERPLRPAYGWEAHLMPRIATAAERAIASVLAERALARWAPRLGIDRVDVEAVEEGTARLVLHRGGGRHRLRVTLRSNHPGGEGEWRARS